MKKRLLFLILTTLLSFPISLFGQKNARLNEFSDYKAIEDRILRLKKKPDSALFFVKLYIAKAKRGKDFKKLIHGYDYAKKNSLGENLIKYGDSMITAAVKLKDNDEIGEAFISLGQIYMENEQYKEALDHTLSGYEYFKINDNAYLLYTAKQNIATIKTYLNDYYDAKKINGECVAFFREHRGIVKDTDYTLYYLYSLIALINNNTQLQDFEDNAPLIKEGISFTTKNTAYQEYLPYFISAQGIQAYYQKNYNEAIGFLAKSLASYRDKWEHKTDRFYLGMSYYQLKQWNKAEPLLQSILSEYDQTKKLDPEFRPAFEAYIDHYKETGENSKLLTAIENLLEYDKNNATARKNIGSQIKTEYDEKLLEETKHKILRQRFWEWAAIGILSIVTIASVIFVIRNNNKKKRSTTKNSHAQEPAEIQNLPQENPVKTEPILLTDYEQYKPISKETVRHILEKLEAFEAQKHYTKPGLKLYDIAEKFGTNERYLSKIISISRGKNFNQYINGLRLTYFEKLKTSSLQNQSLKSLALQSGFDDYSLFYRVYKEWSADEPKEELLL